MYFDAINPSLILQNNTPQEDFCGMTPSEIHHLIYDGWTDKSPIRLQPAIADETIEIIPFFRVVEELVRIIKRDEPVKLTARGFLPVKIPRELYNFRFIPEWYIDLRQAKVLREYDSSVISCARAIVKTSRLVKKVNGRLFLTEKGERLLQPDARSQLFSELLKTYTQIWAWGNMDGYAEAYGVQQLWGFSVHLLFQFGFTPQKVTFYAEKFLVAFPLIAEQFPLREYSNPIDDFERCYIIRTFERFLYWWGFVKIEGNTTMLDWKNQVISATPLLREVFLFD
ncbi:MAG: hypothetical protein NT004_04290 [Bacteroidetes bacterium]|nr:hypothetical protein [Bacteroidota bacterium]